MDLIEENSVAAVVYYKNEYLLLKYGLGHWEYAKGHMEKEETEKETIMRELEEETGIKEASIIEGFNEKYDYVFTSKGKKIHKFVSCYLIKSNTRDVTLSFEHVGYKWLSFQKAIKQLSYANAKKILKKAHNFRLLTSV